MPFTSNKFLEKYKSPKWAYEIVNLNSLMSGKEIEFIIKQFPIKKI